MHAIILDNSSTGFYLRSDSAQGVVDNLHTRLHFAVPGVVRIVQPGYDKVSDQPFIWVREMDESESGQMVLEKVKWTFFDVYLWQTMWNHAKKSMEGSKLSDLLFLQWEVTDWQELFAKNAENKGN